MFMVLLGRMGYRQYTCTITSLSFGQIGEFSLILAALGVSLGHISEETLGLIALPCCARLLGLIKQKDYFCEIFSILTTTLIFFR